jgi:histidinol-phosphatase (PHP family)
MAKYLINHHVHTTGSDGELSPRETAELAIKKGLSFICFTDHYSCPEGFDKFFYGFHSEEYYREALRVKEEYKGKLEISFGAEFNWVPEHMEWLKREYDYTLGSIHHVPTNLPKPGNGLINESEKVWMKLLEEHGGVKNLVREYYHQAALASQSNLFDCIAHFDLVKIWNANYPYFSERDEWYRKKVSEALDQINYTGTCIEINTSAKRKGAEEFHPSFWILEEMCKREIPITISSDSHYESHIDYGLEDAIEIARKAGYTSILKFKERRGTEVKI